MSLREFHIVFITAVILLALGFAYWGFIQYQLFRQIFYAWTSIFSLLAVAGFAIYEISFIQKTKS